jgi:hypothetical protein
MRSESSSHGLDEFLSEVTISVTWQSWNHIVSLFFQ